MSLETDRFLRRLTRRIGDAGLKRVRFKIPSNTLRRELELNIVRLPRADSTFKATLHVSSYWSLYVHDGRRPFSKNRLMLWFRDKSQDPRLNAGRTPQRLSQVKHLSRQQWLTAIARRREWIEGGGDPFDAPVIITRAVRKGTRPTAFFGNGPGEGMYRFVEDAGRIGAAEFSEFIKEDLGRFFHLSDTAAGDLRI